jgi:NAD(P)-dependent dehydrogenase (short-subunit alcohol dehydrogenase family)
MPSHRNEDRTHLKIQPMIQRLQGKVALITGAGSGIGRGCAVRLAAEGASVVIADLESSAGSSETLTQIRQNRGTSIFQPTDVSHEGQCQKAIEAAVRAFGGVDILVNNAGIYPRASLQSTTEALWDRIFGVNLKGPFFLCKHVVAVMRSRGGGSIINVGSVHGLGGAGKLFAYSVSKGGLLTLTRNLAIALAADRIRVNYLIPGWVLSKTEIAIQQAEGHDEEWLSRKAASLAMGRFQTPEDAANIVAFLASNESLMITGCIMNGDAGYSVRCIGTEDE